MTIGDTRAPESRGEVRASIKIGELVRAYVGEIFKCCDINELTNLLDRQYSKDAFDIYFPFCAEIHGILHERYWKDIHVVHGRTLRVCSQWFEKSREPFCNYIVSKGIATPAEVQSLRDNPPVPKHRTSFTPHRIKLSWPEWASPNADELLNLAEMITPYIRFLHPDIVRAVVTNNEHHRNHWSDRLENHGINPSLYLWQDSSCAFPGVRRYAGSTEIARHRGRMDAGSGPEEALKLDDNDFPKHIWSFVFRGRPFEKHGPSGHSLAHLFDHKKHGNRHQQELEDSGNYKSEGPYFGLYTCVTNAVYIPTDLIRPTDCSFLLRNLIQRKANAVYGEFCKLLPPHRAVVACGSDAWRLNEFEWCDPVGTLDHVHEFLTYRNKKMTELFASVEA